MTGVSWDRWAAATGALFSVFLVVGFFVIGSLPGLDDSPADTAGFYVDHRRRILIGVILIGLALSLFLWFIGSLGAALREAGEQRLAAVAFGAGVALVALVAVAIAIVAALAEVTAGRGGQGVTQALNDLQWSLGVLTPFPAFVFIEAAGIAILRSGLLARWFGWVSIAGSVLFLLGGTTWKRNGLWAPDGAYTQILVIVFAVWVLAASLLLVQRLAAAEHEAAPMPA